MALSCIKYVLLVHGVCATSKLDATDGMPLILIQHKAARRDWPLPVLKPMQHSFFSTNASGSAAFITRYFKGSRILKSTETAAALGTRLSSSQKTIVVEYCPRPDAECMIMKFVEIKNSMHRQMDFVRSSQDEWSRVAKAAMGLTLNELTGEYSHSTNYSTWIDFHDGMSAEGFDVDLAIKDGLLMQKYFGPLRITLPFTLYTLELIGFTQETDDKLNDYAGGFASPDHCRFNERGIEVGRQKRGNFWWKSTFAAVDPEAAKDFAVHVLGAQSIQSPFVEEKNRPDCPVVRWVVLPTWQNNTRTEKEAGQELFNPPHGIMLHFVKNTFWPSGNLTVDELAQDQELHRHMDRDHFDEYMYNHVGFQTASLDPFIERLQKLRLPFIARKSNEEFEIYVNVPKNNIVFKISSPKAPAVLDARNVRSDEAP